VAAGGRTVRNWNRGARRALSGFVLMALASACRTDVALEAEVGSAGVAGRMLESAGSAGGFSRGGRGSAGDAGSAARGGATATSNSGGSAGKGDTPGGAGSSGSSGSVSTGGGAGGEAGAPGAGTSQGVGGAPTDAEGGAPSEGGAGGAEPSPTQEELEEQTIARWNEVADDRPTDTYGFHWVEDRFPHPTFTAMGTAEGYGEFAIVLDEFLDRNFDFLAEHRQFLTRYYYVTVATSDVDLMVTFDQLATDFSTGFGAEYGDHPDDVELSLADHATNMKQFE
jgi:hypothetical protein